MGATSLGGGEVGSEEEGIGVAVLMIGDVGTDEVIVVVVGDGGATATKACGGDAFGEVDTGLGCGEEGADTLGFGDDGTDEEKGVVVLMGDDGTDETMAVADGAGGGAWVGS